LGIRPALGVNPLISVIYVCLFVCLFFLGVPVGFKWVHVVPVRFKWVPFSKNLIFSLGPSALNCRAHLRLMWAQLGLTWC
jgi:hypothetical protein